MPQPRTTLRPRLPAPGHTMTEQFEWTKDRLGSLTYLVQPALGWKYGNVAVKTSAGTTGHVGAPTTSSTVSQPRSSRTRRTNPPGSCNDCFRSNGLLHPLLRAELTTQASVRARRELRGPTPSWGWGELGRPSVCACASPTSERCVDAGWNSGFGGLELSSGKWIDRSKDEEAFWGPRVMIYLPVGPKCMVYLSPSLVLGRVYPACV